MKVLVIGHLTGKDIRPHLEAEGRRVAELRADGLVRDEAKNALERVAEEHRESTAGPGAPAPEDSSARGREEGSG